MTEQTHTYRPEIASQIAFPWIVRLRYGLAIGQAISALVAAHYLRLDIPLAWITLGPVFVVLSNLFLTRRAAASQASSRQAATASLLTWIFFLDTICLTALLMLSGGPSNPFTLLYLVNITLSATILTNRQTWALGLFSIACFALLFWLHHPVPQLGMHHYGELHLVGMWVSFAVAVFLVALYASKISSLLRDHEASLLRMQDELARKDRLASLVTLAAGAAHELSTPLSTIAVVAKELERFASQASLAPAVAEDSRLIRQEVDRCRAILQRMSVDGAEPAGEASQTVPVPELLQSVYAAFPVTSIVVSVDEAISSPLQIPKRAVEQALIALVKNAIEAGDPSSPVTLRAVLHQNRLKLCVEDRGSGMTEETQRRVGEPFYTTKPTGQGMGLGVFLARTLAERLDGELSFHPGEFGGTSAVFELPYVSDHEERRKHVYSH